MLMPRRLNNSHTQREKKLAATLKTISNLSPIGRILLFLMFCLTVHSATFAQDIGLRGLDGHVVDIDWSPDGTLIAYT